jgi:hypothetical protein
VLAKSDCRTGASSRYADADVSCVFIVRKALNRFESHISSHEVKLDGLQLENILDVHRRYCNNATTTQQAMLLVTPVPAILLLECQFTQTAN